MTIRQAIDEFTGRVAVSVDEGILIKWLSRCETILDRQIVQRYRCAQEPFSGFDEDTDDDTQLLAPEPYDSLYGYWLEAQMHYTNADIDRYNNAIAMFNTEVSAFRREYLKQHRPRSGIRFRF